MTRPQPRGVVLGSTCLRTTNGATCITSSVRLNTSVGKDSGGGDMLEARMADQHVDGPEVGYGLVQSRLQTGLGGDIARAAARHGPSRAERARDGHGTLRGSLRGAGGDPERCDPGDAGDGHGDRRQLAVRRRRRGRRLVLAPRAEAAHQGVADVHARNPVPLRNDATAPPGAFVSLVA